MSHHHGHDHTGHGHEDHSHGHGDDHSDETVPALQTLIWKQIDFDNIRTLNESEPDAGAKIVKRTWHQRLEADPELESDADEQLLMFVPYVAAVLHQTYNISLTCAKLRRRFEATRNPYVFSESTFPILNQILSLETCLGSFHSIDVFQGSSYPLTQARLTPKS